MVFVYWYSSRFNPSATNLCALISWYTLPPRCQHSSSSACSSFSTSSSDISGILSEYYQMDSRLKWTYIPHLWQRDFCPTSEMCHLPTTHKFSPTHQQGYLTAWWWNLDGPRLVRSSPPLLLHIYVTTSCLKCSSVNLQHRALSCLPIPVYFCQFEAPKLSSSTSCQDPSPIVLVDFAMVLLGPQMRSGTSQSDCTIPLM